MNRIKKDLQKHLTPLDLLDDDIIVFYDIVLYEKTGFIPPSLLLN